MSNITVIDQNLPDFLQQAGVSNLTKQLAGNSGIKRIVPKNGIFRKVVGKEEMGKVKGSINAIIVNASAHVGRIFYIKAWTPDSEPASPDCFSNDGVSPDSGAANPQASRCDSCPQNIKGSGQGDSRACRFSQRIAVALENNLDGDVYQVALPGQSIFGTDNSKMPLQQYAKFLGGHGIPVTAVVTEMRFDTASATPKLTFKAVRPLSVQEMATAKQQGESADALNAVAMTVNQIDGTDKQPALPATFDKPAAAAPAAQAEPVKEPTKVSKTKVESKNVAAVLDEWADDAE